MSKIGNFGQALPVPRRNLVERKVKPATEPRKAKPLQFEARKWRDSGIIFIMKTGDKLHRPLKQGFANWQEARDYRLNNHNELVRLWEAMKLRDNVTEDSIRTDSEEITHVAENITPEMVMTHFMPRGVEFGAWMIQSDRQTALNKFWSAMWDLEQITGKNPWEWCKGLGLGFGSRGSGSANAHYENGCHVINLTKTRGKGALFHELWHSHDADKPHLKLPKIPAFDKRCEKADKSKSKKYWSTDREKIARAFENYCLFKLGKLGIKQEFGVNVVSPEKFSKDLSAYPYLLPEELPTVVKFFDAIFEENKNENN